MPDFVFRCGPCRYNFHPPAGVDQTEGAGCPVCGGQNITKIVARDENVVLETGLCGPNLEECAG